DIYRAQAKSQNKPEKVVDRIVEGKLEKYFQEVCLLEQPFIKDEHKIIQEIITEAIAKLGENISVKRFARFRVGE
ncbi:MAG: elongation factor Ts, partial [Candidatus Zixiibacteriota bacterium]